MSSAFLAEVGFAVILSIVLWVGSMIASPIVMARKGRSPVLGFVLGLLLGFVGLIVAVLMAPATDDRLASRGRRSGFSREDAERLGVPASLHGSTDTSATRTCPSCGSKIPFVANVCRVCQVAIPTGG